MTKKGFTLVEIMIVVAIIALLAAIAIPNLLRARLNANESATIEAMKTISGASISFASVNNAVFPTDFSALSTATPPYLDGTFTGANTGRNGYNITYTRNADTLGFYSTAVPVNPGVTGSREFYVDDGGVVCWAPQGTGAASAHAGGACPGSYSALQ